MFQEHAQLSHARKAGFVIMIRIIMGESFFTNPRPKFYLLDFVKIALISQINIDVQLKVSYDSTAGVILHFQVS